jgi:hypothetical protein
MKESPIFVKSFETIRWILDHTKKFPKHQRFVMARRVEDAALSFHDCLIGAVKPPDGRKLLKEADFHLERLKTYNRFCRDLKLLSFGQYEHLAGRLDELGRLLGGWQKRVAGEGRKPARGAPPDFVLGEPAT